MGDASLHELERHARLFDSIERSPLTQEQRVAAVTMASRQLVIAAAGSGKTSTMVGKVAHALCSGQCTPEQILVLAFNRKAALELDERLQRSLARVPVPGARVAARTLHALGLEIVTRSHQRRPEVRDVSTEMLDQILTTLVEHDLEFAEHWLMFRVFWHTPVCHPDRFSTHRQWRHFVARHGERRYRRIGFSTLRGELVETQFEQAVANWLYLHDIDYAYGPIMRSPVTSQNTFALRRIGLRLSGLARRSGGVRRRPLCGKVGFWLVGHGRHVICVEGRGCMSGGFAGLRRSPGAQALDRDGRVAYAGTSGQHPGQDIFVDLNSFRMGLAFSLLRRALCPDVVVLPSGRLRQMVSVLGHGITPGQRDFLSRFIRLARLAGGDHHMWIQRASQGPDPDRAVILVSALKRLVDASSQALNDAGAIDFEGMLRRAADCLAGGGYQHPYTLILVDEFQDTSHGGIRLLQALLAQNLRCRLFAVGDDWQSIYRFAGAVPDVLSRFDHYFGAATVNYLTTTFRFDQHVADLAGRFVQQNPEQLRKRVRARAPDHEPSIVLAWYATIAHMHVLCEGCLDECAKSRFCRSSDGHGSESLRMSVYILGRYQHQRPPAMKQWQARFPTLDIEFLTVHSAKGLEADVVIVPGLSTGRHGFPSEVQNDPLMALVTPGIESFPDAEERRLFYVALTRCRYRLYLLADMYRPSCFVTGLREIAAAVPIRVLGSEQAWSPPP